MYWANLKMFSTIYMEKYSVYKSLVHFFYSTKKQRKVNRQYIGIFKTRNVYEERERAKLKTKQTYNWT